MENKKSILELVRKGISEFRILAKIARKAVTEAWFWFLPSSVCDSGHFPVSLSTEHVDFEKQAIIYSMSFMEKHRECRHGCLWVVTDAQCL